MCDKYIPENMLYSLLANNQVLLFCPPWASMRRKAREKNLHTGLLYRFGFRRLDTGDESSPSLNSKWAPLWIYHNKLLPNEELCIIHMPQKPAVVTYVDVLHKNTLKIWSFLHIPGYPVTASNTYTPFPDLEKKRDIRGESVVGSGHFDIAKAVESDLAMHVAEEFDTLIHTSPDTVFPLQGTLDGYYWKSIGHWLTVEPRLKQFHHKDHIFVLADVVLEMRNAVLSCFCSMVEASDTICEVLFCETISSSARNTRILPVLSLADMEAVVRDANESLTIKAFMSTNVAGDKKYGPEEFQPLEMLVSDPWLLFALRTFLPRDSPLFELLQNSKILEPIVKAVVFTVRETFNMGNPTVEYMRLWTDTAVDIRTEKLGPEGLSLLTITSPLVEQMNRNGALGTHLKECGGIASSHGQNEHTTAIFLTGDTAYTYDDTIPFLIKASKWNKDKLGSMLVSPLERLGHLLCDSHSFRDECETEVL